MTKITHFGTHFDSILEYFCVNFGTLGRLGATLGPQRLRCAFQVSFFTDFVSQWKPHWGPKKHTGGLQVATELPRTSFGVDFLRTYFLHEIWLPKIIQKAVFFGTVDVAKTV